MPKILPAAALTGLLALTGCGGGGSRTNTTGGTSASTGSVLSVLAPVVTSTFNASNAGEGVNPAATATSGAGASQPTMGAGGTAADTVTRIEVSPATASVETNRRLTFTALGRDAGGNPVVVPDANWQWTSSDPHLALLTSTGSQASVSGVQAGTTTIRVLEGKSGQTAQVTLTVTAAGVAAPPGGTGTTAGTSTPSGTVVYANDFTNGAGPGWSNSAIDTTPGSASHPAAKFLGQFGAGTVSLSLNSIPAHTGMTVTFDLFIIRSWDGNATDPALGPDTWDLSVEGGKTLLHTTFANVTPQETPSSSTGFYQAFPDTYPPNSHPYQSGASDTSALGYTRYLGTTGQNVPSDAVYHLTYTFPHTASTVKFNFTSGQTQAASDESWGLKNVQITANS